MNESRKPMSDEQLDQLLAQARLMRPETERNEFAFETRLQARLRLAYQPGQRNGGAHVA